MQISNVFDCINPPPNLSLRLRKPESDLIIIIIYDII